MKPISYNLSSLFTATDEPFRRITLHFHSTISFSFYHRFTIFAHTTEESMWVHAVISKALMVHMYWRYGIGETRAKWSSSTFSSHSNCISSTFIKWRRKQDNEIRNIHICFVVNGNGTESYQKPTSRTLKYIYFLL